MILKRNNIEVPSYWEYESIGYYDNYDNTPAIE